MKETQVNRYSLKSTNKSAIFSASTIINHQALPPPDQLSMPSRAFYNLTCHVDDLEHTMLNRAPVPIKWMEGISLAMLSIQGPSLISPSHTAASASFTNSCYFQATPPTCLLEGFQVPSGSWSEVDGMSLQNTLQSYSRIVLGSRARSKKAGNAWNPAQLPLGRSKE